MTVKTTDLEQLVDRWEDQRDIKNLMGRLSYAIYYKQEAGIFDHFWSGRADVCFGMNDGWYVGPASIRAYYDYVERLTQASDVVKKARFPEICKDRTPEQLHAMGNQELKSLSLELVEVADDGDSAKGLWGCFGMNSEPRAAGPVTVWTCGNYFADFVREDGQWRIWHLQYLEDINHTQGRRWWGEQAPLPEFPEFAPLAEIRRPAPDKPCQLFTLYSTERPFQRFPEPPKPYKTFAETFSYGL